MRIALDAMGGDNAPHDIVLGALEAAHQIDGEIILVGDEQAVKGVSGSKLPGNITIRHASEVITMEDKPLDALKRKRDSSLSVAIDLVKQGEADAVVSAGNTGAATAGSLLAFRQISGVKRPAIATTFPGRHGRFLLLDAGASPDVDPESLVEFAHMGREYCKGVMGIRHPKVHLLNIGEEPTKGNAFARTAFEKLSNHHWFAGNIEGKDKFQSECHVVVCDAFVGNIVLKTSEGVAEYIMKSIREGMPKSKIMQLQYLPLKKLMAPLRKKMDYAEYGGSPLLGLNGLCFICHGRSNPKAIKNALLECQRAVHADVVSATRRAIEKELSHGVAQTS